MFDTKASWYCFLYTYISDAKILDFTIMIINTIEINRKNFILQCSMYNTALLSLLKEENRKHSNRYT